MDRVERRRSLRLWLLGFLLARAVVVTAVGILLLLRPSDTIHTMARLLGVILMVFGAIDLVLGLVPGADRRSRRLVLLRGLLTAAIGAVVFFLTEVTVTAVAILVGMQLVVSGGVSVLLSLQVRRRVGAWIGVTVRGLISIVTGALALVWPRATVAVLAVLFAVFFFLDDYLPGQGMF